MSYSKKKQWDRFKKLYTEFPQIGLAVDLSRMNFRDDFIPSMEARMQEAFMEMDALEAGAIANPDEKRMVGHYWLRNPGLSPTPAIRKEVEEATAHVKEFARLVHAGTVRGSTGNFKNLLLIGIGGSALGPQFVASALGHPARDKIRPYFFDNTDPDGMERVIAGIRTELGQTLCVVVSKSGGTRETRNGMLEAKAHYEAAGLAFEQHCVAITQMGSELDRYATENGWIERFPMWDWVGGRTSELSTVGLLPAALQGISIDEMLAGAKACDDVTRSRALAANPAVQLALAWYFTGNGKGEKNMVVIPYKDRLELFSKYLQQLIMESIGKKLDMNGAVVNQGIAVFGNKGSTDQHSYIQQLRDGVDNFFVTFVEVLKDHDFKPYFVEDNVTSGDYLQGFLLGTREALFQSNRESITVTVREVSPFIIGMLIALFERAVGFYASLVKVNAYNQPGVEAGKKAASEILELQSKILSVLCERSEKSMTAEEIAKAIDSPDESEHVFKICEHLSSNRERGLIKLPGKRPTESKYQKG